MKRIMNILFLSCLKASALIEKKLHFSLTFQERLQLRIHKMMCEACTLYEKQSEFLEQAIGSHHKPGKDQGDLDKLKAIIAKKLAEQKPAK
jgi:hypothetical protein